MFSLGLFINDINDIYKLETLQDIQVQLGFYRVQMYRDFGVRAKEICKERNLRMESIHLPTKDMTIDLVHEIMALFNVEKATIHAHDNIMKMLVGELSWKVCLENFPYKSDRRFRTPIDIISATAENPKLGMTFDICHAEMLWLDPIILSSILKYTDIIHLSNKKWDRKPSGVDADSGFHIPIHGFKGVIDTDKVLGIILKQFHWKGEIVLEYMPTYFEKAKSDFRKLEENWSKFLIES